MSTIPKMIPHRKLQFLSFSSSLSCHHLKERKAKEKIICYPLSSQVYRRARERMTNIFGTAIIISLVSFSLPSPHIIWLLFSWDDHSRWSLSEGSLSSLYKQNNCHDHKNVYSLLSSSFIPANSPSPFSPSPTNMCRVNYLADFIHFTCPFILFLFLSFSPFPSLSPLSPSSLSNNVSQLNIPSTHFPIKLNGTISFIHLHSWTLVWFSVSDGRK